MMSRSSGSPSGTKSHGARARSARDVVGSAAQSRCRSSPAGMRLRKYEKKKKSENDTFDDQRGGVEVQEQAHVQTCRFQIGFELGIVEVGQSRDSLELQNDLLTGNQVETLQADIFFLKGDVNFLLF